MVVRALAAVERSRVALILVDATVGFTEQDSKVAGYAHEQGKACIIVVNKWDAVEGKETNTMEHQRRDYADCFSFMGYAPIIFISAQTGYNVNKLMQLIRDVDAENGATEGKVELAKLAKQYNLDAIHDTVHEMARDEARHGKAFEGLLKRYFG